MEARGPRLVGRYSIFEEIAAGGMATVHYGRLLGDAGFSRTVAVKVLYPHLAKDPDFAAMFLDEARLAARIRHPNVVQTLDVVAVEGELIHVMEYVHGESLYRALRAATDGGAPPPLDVTSGILCAALHGLHAAHEAKSDRGEPLNLVHRDVSPQNILLGADGAVRILDFGVAKAAGRSHTTRDGGVKGKLGYMSPEQLHDKKLDRRTDIFASGIVLWETITGRRLFRADTEAATVQKVLELAVEPPSKFVPGVPGDVDRVVMKALQRHPSDRFPTARDMALALEASIPVASATRIAAWLEEVAGDVLAARARTLAQIEEGTTDRSALPGSAKAAEAATEGSDVSTVSVDAPGAKAGSARPRWIGYALVALLAGGSGLLVSRARRAPDAPPAVTATSEPRVAATPADPPPPASVPPATPPSPNLSVETSSTAAPPVKASPNRPPKPRPPSPATTPAAKKPCVPSFVDDAGIKQYRACP